MQIREGKYYRARCGDVVGPMKRSEVTPDGWASNSYNWYGDGSFPVFDYTHDLDLIAEVYVSDTPPAVTETVRFNPTAELKLVRPNDPLVEVQNTPPAVKETEDKWRERLLAAGPNGPLIETHDRKTLRDEFAMAALKAMLGHSDYVELSPAQMAVEAYRQADAMMEARNK
jgi:hypothetical protein